MKKKTALADLQPAGLIGLGLMGRGILTDNHDPLGRTGSVYQFLAPEPSVPSRPGEWRKLSLTLVGRTVTLAVDGVTVISEAEPGPIILQGDRGAVSFRNIVLTPAIP